jgi:hypothetical protein
MQLMSQLSSNLCWRSLYLECLLYVLEHCDMQAEYAELQVMDLILDCILVNKQKVHITYSL